MPLAAPLILPFAELAGITIAGLGMAAASKKVSDFISDNPETSTQILTMLVPGGQGLNALFKKKASVTLEDVEDMTDEEAQDLSDEDIAGVMNEAGKTKGPGKRERMIEISRKLGLSGEGKERKKIIDDIDSRYDEGGVEDAPKPKFDYKKFFRNRNADGGAIGIEVLFEEKKDGGRIGFANGGENIIGADLKDPDTDMNEMIPSGGINFSDIKNYASIPATYGAALYGNYINQRVGENMARAFRTDEMNERLSQQVGDKLSTGVNSGGLTYTDFGLDPVREYIGGGEYRNTRDFNPPSFEKAMSLNSADLANALTLGNLNFNRDPSGNINYTGNRFDFPQPTFMNNRPIDVPLDELNVNAPQFSFTDYLQGNYDLNKSPTTNIFETPDIMVDANEGFRTPTRTNIQGMDLEMDPGARINPDIQPQQNIFQRAGDVAQKGIGFLKDSPGMLLSAASGIPFAGSILSGLGNMFEYRGGMGYVDEDGVFRSADELDKLNARGGYYTDAARASRNRASRIQNMLARQAAGKRISEQNLLALQEQQAKEEAARQAAFDAIMSSQQSQQNFYDSLNEGRGATSTAESRSTAGDAPGYSGPSPFAKGGLATMFVEKR